MSSKHPVISLDSALKQLAAGQARLLSGGTDYYPGLNDAAPSKELINVRSIDGLGSIKQVNGHWRIGASVTWSELIHSSLPPSFHCLKQAGREVGSVQIQNSATVVGNICNASPAADGVPALLVLNAQIEITSVKGAKVLPLSEFIMGVREVKLAPGEMVTAIVIPDDLSNDRTEFIKLGSRSYLVISIVMCASRIRVDERNRVTDAAIAVGACSPVAQRLTELESALVGQACDVEVFSQCVEQQHLANLSPIDDVRASAQYRLKAVRVLVQRQLSTIASARLTGPAS